MSSGNFVKTLYQVSGISGGVCFISVQSETFDAESDGIANAPAGAPVTLPISAIVNGGKRQLGIIARAVYLKLPAVVTPPTGYAIGSRTKIPALTENFFNACLTTKECTYLGLVWEVTGVRQESLR